MRELFSNKITFCYFRRVLEIGFDVSSSRLGLLNTFLQIGMCLSDAWNSNFLEQWGHETIFSDSFLVIGFLIEGEGCFGGGLLLRFGFPFEKTVLQIGICFSAACSLNLLVQCGQVTRPSSLKEEAAGGGISFGSTPESTAF